MNWLRFYFRWHGRIDRAGFLGGLFVVSFGGALLAAIAVFAFVRDVPSPQLDMVVNATSTSLWIPFSSLAARRLHDLGASARWLIVLPPYVIVLAVVALRWPGITVNTWQSAVLLAPYAISFVWLLAAPGQRSANKYGTPEQASVSPMAKQ